MQREAELRQQKDSGIIAGNTVRDAFDKHEKEVSRGKTGHRFEALRMAILVDIENGERKRKSGDIKPSELSATHLGMLRDARPGMQVAQRAVDGAPAPAPAARTVNGSTVNRVFNLLSHVFTIACREWKSAASRSPTSRPSDQEIERLNVLELARMVDH